MKHIDLKGNWNLRQMGQEDYIPATVPGDNYSALLAAGRISDPYYRKNELDVQWVKDFDWEYSRDFEADEALIACKSVYLNADILDTFATIHINGKKVVATDNMFKRVRVEIGKYLQAGKNTIAIVFRSAAKEALKELSTMPYEVPYSAGNNTVPYMNYIRKVQCHAGWDWGVSLMVSGIYGDISIHAVEQARIDYIYTEQLHEGKTCKVRAIAELNAPVAGKIQTEFKFNGEVKVVKSNVTAGVNTVKAEFEVKNPRLWWPVGAGEPFLYKLEVSTGDETLSREIGLRTIKVINEKDEHGISMKFRVNGVDIFCKGANWIPADAMPQRQTPEVYEDLLESAAEVGMNMLRVWGGGQYEQEVFYEKCDQKGIMVWQDMMFSCALYPSSEKFITNVKEELEYQIKRLRSHASMAIWCGDNECIGAVGWFSNNKDRTVRDRFLVNYDRLNRELDRAVKDYAPEFIFWPSSPCGGPGNFGDNWHDDSCGDMHYWKVWHGREAIEAYFNVSPRFCSEFGFQSFPSREIFDTFATGADANVFSPIMEHHQKCGRGNGNIIAMFERYFRMPEGFDNFLYLSQVTQALAIKTGVEHWRRQMPVCMGTLYWQLNDNWPVASWASIEYGGKWKPLHYHARRFFAPALSSTFQKDNELEIWSVNDSREQLKFSVNIKVYDFSGKELDAMDFETGLAAGTTKKLKTLKLDALKFDKNAAFMQVSTIANGKNATHKHTNTHFFEKFKTCELAEAKVKLTAREGAAGLEVVLSTDHPAFFVFVEAIGVKGVFEDNSITLMPGETVLRFKAKQQISLDEFSRSLCVKHLRETY